MNIPLLLNTIRFLRPSQVWYQLWHKVYKPRLRKVTHLPVAKELKICEPIAKPRCYEGGERFTFLNIADDFRGWQMAEHGPLWTYNLNYMDWLEQEGLEDTVALLWIDRFLHDLPENRVGQDPYPTALRLINWAKFFTRHSQYRTKQRMDLMYAQVQLLTDSLEYHLQGNHLLEDAYALFICSLFFADQKLYDQAKHLLLSQLKEQILTDGAHYEQSPMYHCILLDRLLDCVNFSLNNILFPGQSIFNEELKRYASLMLGHLDAILYADGSLPLLNDAAQGIAPTAHQLFSYAKRLNVSWEEVTMRDCGYRCFSLAGWEVTVDVGNVTATHQPGHTHADTFNFELRVDGWPVVVDTGVSTYNKNQRRQYERSTAAHNTVTIGGKDSSQVWGGFRVGKRARVTLLKDEPLEVTARHDGYGRQHFHQRNFQLTKEAFVVKDEVLGSEVPAVFHLHLAPGLHAVQKAEGVFAVGALSVTFEGYQHIDVQYDSVSFEYNRLQQSEVLSVTFVRSLSTSWRRS